MGQKFFFLKRKKYGTLDSLEESKLELLDKIHLDFDDTWHDYEYLEHLPVKLFKEPDINYSNLPKENEIFFRITNGYLIINEKLYDVISQFNLGKTHFSQVHIYNIETKEQLSDVPYYFINIAEKRDYLDVDNSKGLGVSMYNPQWKQRFIGISEDDDIKLSHACLADDIDLWHEPILLKSLFFSDRLANALLDSGFTKEQLGLIRCIIQ
ncbi:hypothetical protein IM753_09015 [Moraxella sp. K127]|uniref:imm11 family protein n=1 Tax=Moraxella TaxID=475 RepID=UPI001882F6FE|nr:DUF1629 domain-containing protein [Moraxella sp. K127]MBE9591111.1 hypothetical protein [Moraxella sp. K127]